MGPVMKNTLKETMKKRPVFGATVLSGSPMMVEALGQALDILDMISSLLMLSTLRWK